ncbi:MAG: Ig-like domain-containing protein [Candidatus Colwellbacteria bacterium]|nr:Ig-like domain-containing protein [Candidatus Colwellbacteria bacterium]
MNIINPYGATLTAPASVEIIASVADDDGVIGKVEFFEGTNLLGAVSQAPWSMRWVNIAVGDYSLTAVATDDKGAKTTSYPVTFKVSWATGGGRTNSPPTISLSGVPSASSTPALTVSGNEITDATRTTNTQGDGRTTESSFGMWEASTNRITNGGLETNTTGWTTGGTNILARSTTQAKFGVASAKVTYADSATLLTGTINGVTASLIHWASAWVYIPSDWDGGQVRITTPDFVGSASSNQLNADMLVVNQWQRIWVMTTPVAGDMAGTFLVDSASAPSAGKFIYIDGLQWERSQGVATPYIHTDGAEANRNGGRLQASTTLINTTQGWFATRIQIGWSRVAEPSGTPRLARWYDTDNDRLEIHMGITTDVISLRRKASGVGAEAEISTPALALNDLLTVIGTWAATQSGISVNGSAFTKVANNNIPVLAATTLDIGNAAATGEVDGQMFWFAAGTGTLSDADASTINGFGSTDPNPLDFPYDSSLTFLWKGDNASSSAAVTTATATASDYDGNITQVVFTDTATDVVTDTTSPFSAQIPLSVGTHTISAIATDNEGATTRSASSTIVVD